MCFSSRETCSASEDRKVSPGSAASTTSARFFWVGFLTRILIRALLPLGEGCDKPFHFAVLHPVASGQGMPHADAPISLEVHKSPHLFPFAAPDSANRSRGQLHPFAMADSASYRDALQQFASLVEPGHDDACIDLAQGALAIARVEYPKLDISYYAQRLDALARRVHSRMRSTPSAREVITLLNQVLFEEEGLRGNRDDYYDPRNSFLNDVLDRKLGIPITLSVVYMEVAQRVGFPVAGTGMPGHFLIKHYDAMSGEIVIDPFNRGRIVGSADCQRRLNEIFSGGLELRPEFLQAVSHREILIRMLNNLRQIYFTKRNFTKGLMVLDLLLAIPPCSPELVRERGLVRLHLERYFGAAQDLGAYLKQRPDAADSKDVRETLDMLRQLLARLN